MDHATPPPGISADAWAATPLVVRPFIGAQLTIQTHHHHLILHLQQEHAARHQRVADLEARLNQHAQNASKPPSSDPPTAPPRPARTPRGRAKGAQPGHPKPARPAPDPDHITAARDHYPDSGPPCQTRVAHMPRDACAVQTPYGWEMPVVEPHSTAHHLHTVCGPACGALVTASRPPAGPPGSFGPRTAAPVAMVHGRYRSRDRAIPRVLQDFAGLPISGGRVVDRQPSVSAALAPV